MKRIILFMVLAAFLGTSCKYFKKDKKVDPVALQKAKEDSIAKAKAFEEEQKRIAEEQARQEEIRKQQEFESTYRFHVIIGSFKVPSNATVWEEEVHKMGFNKTKILDSPNGFKLVSIGQYDTYSKAFNEIERINYERLDEPMEMWVYENK
ncbi:MAG TPA: hypothetical protein DDY04_06320 [Bacteroidales bacterium]|nr:hypothetical protein [Bacteroidales bacterium]